MYRVFEWTVASVTISTSIIVIIQNLLLSNHTKPMDVEDAIRLTENLVSTVLQKLLGTEITYQSTELIWLISWNHHNGWRCKIHWVAIFDAVTTIERSSCYCWSLKCRIHRENDGIGKILNLCFEDYVENLVQPTIVYGHPKEISPLAKASRENPLATERFGKLSSMVVNWLLRD